MRLPHHPTGRGTHPGKLSAVWFPLNSQRKFAAVILRLSFFLVLPATAVMADTLVTLTMDEISSQAIDGLSITKGNETFTFSDPGDSLFYDSTGPGSVTYIHDPSIQGNVETFGVSFSTPVDSVSFGMAENSATALTGASVGLFNGTTSLGTVAFSMLVIDPFAEGQFTWSGGPLTSIVITPDTSAHFLAFDNLAVEVSDITPEPATWLLAAGALVFLLWWNRPTAAQDPTLRRRS